jgi:gluconolactonase
MDIESYAPEFLDIVDPHPPLVNIAQGFTFAEGPVWDKRTNQLFFVDIIGSKVWKWKPGVGKETILNSSGHMNGMTFDHQGRLVVAGWCNRAILRFEKDGSISTIASHFEGKKFNSPNDIVVDTKGATYWTDSAGGLVIPGMVANDVQRYLDYQGVYRLSPDGKEVSLVIGDCTYPNGLAFSPDEKLLYVNDTLLAQIRVFDVKPDGSMGPGRVFHQLTGSEDGVADGMKVDSKGNVYCTGPGGVHVINPAGKLIGRMRIHEHCTNMAWGDDDWQSLYITTFNSIYRTRINIPGIETW